MELKANKLNDHYNNLTKEIIAIIDMYVCAGQWSQALSILPIASEMVSDFEINAAKLQARLGDLLWKIGKSSDALTVLEKAKAVVEIAQDQVTLALILYILGEVHYVKKFVVLEDVEIDPLDLHLRALELREHIRDSVGVAHSLSRIGVIYERLGEDDQAMRFYQQALELCDDIDFLQGKARPITHLGAYHRRQGEKAKALEYYQQALAISQEDGCAEELVFHLVNVGRAIFEVKGDLNAAMAYCQQALKLAESMNFKLAITQSKFVVGSLYELSNEIDKARKYYKQMITIAQTANYQRFTRIGRNKLDSLDEKST